MRYPPPFWSRAGRTACAVLLLAACAGCQVLDYRSPNGETFHRTAFGNKTLISALTVESDSNGVRRVILQGYNSDQVQAIGAISQGVATGVAAGLKP